MDSDNIMQGVVIASLSGIVLFGIGYCFWKNCKSKPSMKPSSSQTDLTGLDDPEEI